MCKILDLDNNKKNNAEPLSASINIYIYSSMHGLCCEVGCVSDP